MATTYAIPDGRVAMAATLFTGNVSTNTISNAVNGVSFQPDLVWLKSRSGAANHTIFDSVRGVNNILYPNLTNANVFSANNLDSFNSNGYTLGANENSNDNSGETSVGWSWKGGGTAVSNTAGSITSSVSANPTAGFSVVTWTGTGSNATVGHGLGVAPSMVIVKRRTGAATDWLVYHSSMAATPQNGYLSLNGTAGYTAYAAAWNNTAPTSTVVSLGNDVSVNANTSTYVAYCFAPVAGYSAFGKYTGNGSADGPFVYLGFRPRFVMIKRSDAGAEGWVIIDSSRNQYNVSNTALYPHSSSAESTYAAQDFTSNGFKIRDTSTATNTSGGTYIYMAFAEVPFKFANAR